MNLAKKLMQIFALIFLAIFLASCEKGCVEKDQFDSEAESVDSYPVSDGIYGTYSSDGGQTAEWHDTGLRSSGEEFIVQISGGWTAWSGDTITADEFENLPDCNYCARRSIDGYDLDSSDPNCICYSNQTPTAEEGSTSDCTSIEDQNNPSLCTCTQDSTYGSALDYGTYHIVLDYFDKYGTALAANDQTACKLKKGMGLNIALFGSDGTTTPTRVYHMFSLEEACNITRNSNGECFDDENVDQTKYVFRSANEKIFIKDDQDGNDDVDSNTGNDEYHKSNEQVKLIIADSYYNDNYGSYYLDFYKGVGSYEEYDSGILEYLVGITEDSLLGKEKGDGEREGGVIEFMYKSIVQDSNFILALQVVLGLYISCYGLAHLFGLAEINRKELFARFSKISLIVFFTSENSWDFYNNIIVHFFKDSMDYVVGAIMDLSDSTIDQSSMVVMAQLDRANDISNATRFSYVDLVINKLLAESTAKKIWGLFFGEVFFGMIYIPAIYLLIGGFIYVMAMVAIVYAINLMKIVFVLALGPLFMCFTLFTPTKGMFGKWLGFLGARSLEILLLFLVLYNFVVIIDKHFTEMFYYRACVENWGKGFFKLEILKSYVSRSLVSWMNYFFIVGGFIFIMKLVVDKVGTLASALIVVSGVKGDNSSFGLAGKMMGQAYGAAKNAAGLAFAGGGLTLSGLTRFGTHVARKTGVADKWNKLGDAVGFRGPRTLYRESFMRPALKRAKAEAKAKKLSGKDADKFIRARTIEILYKGIDGKGGQLIKNPHKMQLAGLDMETASRYLNKKLVEDGLREFLKEEAKKQKSLPADQILFGEEMREYLRKKAIEWANNNLYAGADDVPKLLENMKGFIKKESALSAKEASELFAGKKDLQSKYLEDLGASKFERDRKKGVYYDFMRAYHNVVGTDAYNPMRQGRDFKRLSEYEEKSDKTVGDQVTNFFVKPFATFGDRVGAIIGDVSAKGMDEIIKSQKSYSLRKEFERDSKEALRVSEEMREAAEKKLKQVAEDLKAGDLDTAEQELENAKRNKKESLFAGIGGSIGDALIGEVDFDFGFKKLQPKGGSNAANEQQKNYLLIQQNQSNIKQKLAETEKAIKEAQKKRLKDAGGDQKEIDKLSTEITKLEKEAEKHENDFRSFQSEIDRFDA